MDRRCFHGSHDQGAAIFSNCHLRIIYSVFSAYLLVSGALVRAQLKIPPADFEDLKRQMDRLKVSSVEDFLAALPEEIRKNYVLIYESRNSAQHASKEKPRVILFDPSGKFQVTFAGSNEVKGGNQLEMILQNEQGKFQFSQTVFDPKKGPIHMADPKVCAKCHGSPQRPIWDSYPYWPGTYGSNHDLTITKSTIVSEEDKLKYFSQSREIEYLDAFLAIGSKKDRYALLPGLGQQTYQSLAHNNTSFSNAMVEASGRNTISRLMDSPRFSEIAVSLLTTMQRAPISNTVLFIFEESFKDFPQPLSTQLYQRFRQIDLQMEATFMADRENVMMRFEATDAGLHALHPQRNFMNDQRMYFAYLQTLAEHIDAPIDLPGKFQTLPGQMGGLRATYEHDFKILTDFLLQKYPELRRHITSNPPDRNGMVKRVVSEEGIKLAQQITGGQTCPLYTKVIKSTINFLKILPKKLGRNLN